MSDASLKDLEREMSDTEISSKLIHPKQIKALIDGLHGDVEQAMAEMEAQKHAIGAASTAESRMIPLRAYGFAEGRKLALQDVRHVLERLVK